MHRPERIPLQEKEIRSILQRLEILEMIQKIVTKRPLQDTSSIEDDLAYWLRKTPEERVTAVDYLRRQYHGDTVRLQRSAHVVKRTRR